MTPDKIAEDISLYQNDKGLVLTTDAYLLYCFVSKNGKNTLCELGAGSGLISQLLLVRGKCKSAVCVDVQKDMCQRAEENARLNNTADRCRVVHCDVKDYMPAERVDVVVSNPPYLPRNAGPENKYTEDMICRRETTAEIADFVKCAERCLNFGGCAYFCFIPARQSELFSAMSKAGLEPKECIYVYPTVRHEPSLVLVRGKKGAAPGMTVRRPLIIYKDVPGKAYSDEFELVYKEGRL